MSNSEEKSGSRRRFPWIESEASPLNSQTEQRSLGQSPDQYSTFHYPEKRVFVPSRQGLWELFRRSASSSLPTNRSKASSSDDCSWGRRFIGSSPILQHPWTCFLVIVGLGLYLVKVFPHSTSAFAKNPRWYWDYNAYHPKPTNGPVPIRNDARNLLIAQITGTVALESLVKISSLPNRAYARQWSRDYVRYSSGVKSSRKSCFEKVFVLQTILERQKRFHPAEHAVQYDAIALFPSDAIIIDLDYDLDFLLPPDKLLAMAGWSVDRQPVQTRTDILFFNLQHPLAETVVKLWMQLVLPSDITCGASNDLQLLVQIIRAVIGGDNAEVELDSVIYGLDETAKGFVGRGNHVIKSILPSVPASKFAALQSDLAACKKVTQTTADSVCYRYYPKCEVL